MRNNRIPAILGILLLLFAMLPLPCHAADAQEMRQGIVDYALSCTGADSVQEWLDTDLTDRAGTSAEWYVLALSQEGETYDFSAYRRALTQYLAAQEVTSAATRLKYALVYRSIGGDEGYIARTMDDSVGELGLMSWVFGLHLVNNDRCPDRAQEIVQELFALQLPDGGWAVSGEHSDVDATAMTLQALAPFYGEYPAEIDRAIAFLSAQQRDTGDFASYGVPCPESTAQVLTALLALGYEPLTEERFIKNGCTLLDGIALYRLPDGSFCHTQGGASNENANMQVFFALSALQSGNAPYLFAEPDVSFAAPEVHRMDYRIIVTAAVLPALGIACIASFLRKKRNLKHFLPPCLLAAVLLALVWLVRIERTADYYQPQPAASGEIIGSVSLSIRCDTVAGKAAYIPENGEILGTIEIPITDDTTVFDALTSAVRAHGIRMEYSGTPELAYVKGIADLYEFDHGELSGWVFHVNGESASVGCGEYVLADGDAVEWLYSLDLGKDVAE
jgi:hypothetical protein